MSLYYNTENLFAQAVVFDKYGGDNRGKIGGMTAVILCLARVLALEEDRHGLSHLCG